MQASAKLTADQKRSQGRRNLRRVSQSAAIRVGAYQSSSAVHFAARCGFDLVLPRETSALEWAIVAGDRVLEYGMGAMSEECRKELEVRNGGERY